MNKKSISPVIATVLLIAIVIVLAMIIFLWARGFISETIMKKGENVEQACNKINLEVAYEGEELQITNKGNIPVYRFEARGSSEGITEKIELAEDVGLAIGQSASFDVSGYDSIEVFPVILGDKPGKKAYICKNSFGVAV